MLVCRLVVLSVGINNLPLKLHPRKYLVSASPLSPGGEWSRAGPCWRWGRRARSGWRNSRASSGGCGRWRWCPHRAQDSSRTSHCSSSRELLVSESFTNHDFTNFTDHLLFARCEIKGRKTPYCPLIDRLGFMILLNYLYFTHFLYFNGADRQPVRQRLTYEVPLAVRDKACDISLLLFQCQIQLK